MDIGATITDGQIRLNAQAWVAQRTGAELIDLGNLFGEFKNAAEQRSTYCAQVLDLVALFMTARAGSDWECAEGATVQTPRGGHGVDLSEDLLIQRFTDPIYGDAVFVSVDHGPRGMGEPSVYADRTTDYGQWFDIAADIDCPNGHGWTLTGDELHDQDGAPVSAADTFGPDGIVTTDPNSAATDGPDRIVCTHCGELCAVDLTSL